MTCADIPPVECSETATAVSYRLATPTDELHIITAFSRMLQELEPLGHDVLPTEANVDLFWERVFLPALASGRHGVALAFAEGECVGALIATGEKTPVQVPAGRATLHALWVHPTHRQQGVATALHERAAEALLTAGYTQLLSHVLMRNGAGLQTQFRAGARPLAYLTCIELKGAM